MGRVVDALLACVLSSGKAFSEKDSPAVTTSRRPLSLAITLAVVMLVVLVLLSVGWVLLSVFGALSNIHVAGVYWVLLPIGTTFIILLVVGVIMYLALSVKSINLNRRQSNFVDAVTHELKSPIASLKLYLQTLDRRRMTAEEQVNFHRFMLEEIERLDRLVNHVLDAGRAEAGSPAEAATDVDLPRLLQDSPSGRVRYHVPPGTVRLDVQPCRVRAQPTDLDMIFRNLIDNAVKYAGVTPCVEVAARLEGPWAVVRISDNGRGIPAKMRRKFFGRFVRLGSELERAEDRHRSGAVHRAKSGPPAQRHGARRRSGRRGGALFEVRLPGKPAPQPAAVEPPSAETPAA